MCAELPNEMVMVQRALESDLSVSSVLSLLTVESWWLASTNHINKLHSLQQTLLHELERSAHRRMRSAARRGAPLKLGFLFGGVDLLPTANTLETATPEGMSRLSSSSSLASMASGDWAMMWGQLPEEELGATDSLDEPRSTAAAAAAARDREIDAALDRAKALPRNGSMGGLSDVAAPSASEQSHSQRRAPQTSPTASPRVLSRRMANSDAIRIPTPAQRASQMPAEGESLLRAAASLLVLGPSASAGAGSMPSDEVRERLLSAPPVQLVEHLVALLDEQAQGPPPSPSVNDLCPRPVPLRLQTRSRASSDEADDAAYQSCSEPTSPSGEGAPSDAETLRGSVTIALPDAMSGGARPTRPPFATAHRGGNIGQRMVRRSRAQIGRAPLAEACGGSSSSSSGSGEGVDRLRRALSPPAGLVSGASVSTADAQTPPPKPRADASPMSEWVIALQDVTFQRKIGAGSAGTTYLGAWRGAQVAVKVAGYTGASMDGWRAEVDALTKLRHPNIVQYLGCVVSPPTYCLVLEFCDAGDLYRALRFPTPAGLAMRVARSVCAGMAYLHRRQIMHRDLKSSNVLLTTSGGVKLTDFGVAVQVAGASPSSGSNGTSSPMEASCDPLTTETGTYRWMAPEVTRHEGYTKSADVFSYGMLLFELISHEVPFADRPPLQAAVAIGLQDLRPPLPEGTPLPIATLVKHCWNRRPAMRPKFAEVINVLNQAAIALSPEELAWLDVPSGHPIYGNPTAGAEAGAAANPPPAGGQRPAARAPGVMSAIIEAQGPSTPTEERLTLSVSGT